MSSENRKEELAVGLFDRGLIGYASSSDEFITLKSGRDSPHYANFRNIMSFDKHHGRMSISDQRRVRDLTIDTAAEFIDEKIPGFDHLGPIPQAVTQLGGAIAVRARVSSVNVRVKEGEKGYGKHKPVEGDHYLGETILGFDDVITTGATKEEFTEPVREVGLVSEGFFVLLDRNEGGRSRLEAAGHAVYSLLGMSAVNEMLKENKRISSEQYAWTREYLDEYGD